jgi:hypothetical protein
VAEAARELSRGALDADDHFFAACAMASSATLVANDSSATDARRTNAADQYRQEAVRILKAAVNAGFEDRESLATATDLDSVRAMPEFQTLIDKLGEQ